MSLSAPTQLTQTFCSAGVKNTVPNPSQIGVNPGLASFTDGFPPATRAPVASGGIPPYGEDMNGILNQLSAPIQWQQAGGDYPYSSAFAAAIGGYPLAAMVYSSDGSGRWMSTTANNSADPENSAVPTGWQPVAQRGIASVALTNANVTLTNLQSAKETIVFTGALTANVVVTVPPFIKDYKFVNLTSGAFIVSVKTPTGSAIAVNQGGRLDAYGDGTLLNVPGSSAPSGVVGSARNFLMSTTAVGLTATATADEVLVEVTPGGVSYKLANFNQTINLGTTGAGGMDTGSPPVSGFVGLYAIYNPSTNTRALLAVNASGSSPLPSVYGGSNMPAGYTASSFVGLWPASTVGFAIGFQQDRQFWRTGVTMLTTSTVQASLTALNIATYVPANAKTISGTASIAVNAGSYSLQFSLAESTVGRGNKTWLQNLTYSNGQGFGYQYENLVLSTPQSLAYAFSGGTGSTPTFTLYNTGYTF